MKNTLAGDTPSVPSSMGSRPAWPLSALAASILVLAAFTGEAQALALGRITVLSALGEPLRAEIDVPQISAEEAASFSAEVASPDAFKSAGLEFNSAIGTLQVSLQQAVNGRARLQLRGDKTINDPFVDLVLEARWASGRILRSYTMLLNPPNVQPAQASPVQAAQVQAMPVPPAATGAAPLPSPVTAPSRPRPVATVKPPPSAPVEARPPAQPKADGAQVTVRPGDTAGRIASANKEAHVSLDQMLFALLQANPTAFIGGNINRIKAGAVLDVPSAAQATAVTPQEAQKNIVAQSQNFNEFRRKLAENVPATQGAGADRRAAGKIEARVEDKKPVAPSPDKLTLSKATAQAKADESKIAQTRQAEETRQRATELNKNVADLERLRAATGSAGGSAAAPAKAASASAAPALAVAVPKPTVDSPTAPAPAPLPAPAASAAAATAVAVAPLAASAASAPTPTPTGDIPPAAAVPTAAAPAAEPASAPVAKAPPRPAAPPPPPPETSILDDLIENPMLPLGAGGLVALLIGFGLYRAKRKQEGPALVDSSFVEANQAPDSFFGTSGGQQIDTSDASQGGSSLMYSPSQLDAGGDVDPVAEADVYLAYGRDLQAEEILKEALRHSPGRMAVRAKLHEIFYKRRDVRSFSNFAEESLPLCDGKGPEWEQICIMGKEIDPGNTLYDIKRDGEATAAVPLMSDFNGKSAPGLAATQPSPLARGQVAAAALPLNLDIDLDAPFVPQPPAASAPAPTPAPTAAFKSTTPTPLFTAAPPASSSGVDLDFDLGFDSFAAEPAAAPTAAPVAAQGKAKSSDSHMLEFDLGSLSLDLDSPAEPAAVGAPADDDHQATKLALAQEFLALGDADGARSLAQEVVAEALGPLKAKAERFLADLG